MDAPINHRRRLCDQRRCSATVHDGPDLTYERGSQITSSWVPRSFIYLLSQLVTMIEDLIRQ